MPTPQNPDVDPDPGASNSAKRPQATAPATQAFRGEAFAASEETTLRWLGMAGFLIASRGTTLMIDPLLGGFDMPIMIELPVAAADVPRLYAILVTHSDNDHYSVPSCRDLAPVTRSYHSTPYVGSLMAEEQLPAHGHAIGDSLEVGPVRVTVTPADHAWQNASPGAADRTFAPEDAVDHPGRIRLLAPGQPFTLKRLQPQSSPALVG